MPEIIAPQSRITRRPGMIESVIGRELVGLHIDSGTCYGFNPTAARIWALTEHPISFAGLCSAISGSYDVDEATCAQDVSSLLQELANEGLVEITEPA